MINMLKKINEKTNISKNLLGISLFSNSYSMENAEKIIIQQNESYINTEKIIIQKNASYINKKKFSLQQNDSYMKNMISECIKKYTGKKQSYKVNNFFANEILNKRLKEYINNSNESNKNKKVNENKRKVSKISAMIREMGAENGELYHPELSAEQTRKALKNAKEKAIKEGKSKIELDKKELEIALKNLKTIGGNEESLKITAYEKKLIMEKLKNTEEKTKMEDVKENSNKNYLVFTEEKDKYNSSNDYINKSTQFSYDSQLLEI